MRCRRAIVAVGLGLLTLSGWVSTGCGGGGGGGGGPTTPPPPPPSTGFSFAPDSSAGANSIYLRSGGASGSVFVLDVDVQSMTDVYGVGFVLNYPSDLLSYSKNSESEGAFLSEGGGVDTDLQVDQRTAGEVFVGITRLGEVPGATGSGNLLSLEFTRKTTGSGPMEMTDHDALDSLGIAQVDVNWIGGTITVR